MKKQIIISEEDYLGSIYSTYSWEKSVEIVRYEHDFEKKQYVIDYKEIDN